MKKAWPGCYPDQALKSNFKELTVRNISDSIDSASLHECYGAVVTAIAAHDKFGGHERVLTKLVKERTRLEDEAVRRAAEGSADVIRALRLILLSHLAEGSDPSTEIIRAVATAIEPFVARTIN